MAKNEKGQLLYSPCSKKFLWAADTEVFCLNFKTKITYATKAVKD
jgi:hypothetical protein